MAYHPQCPHCTHMVDTYNQFAQFVQEKHAKVELLAINMSKARKQASDLGVEYFPTIRLFKTDGKVVDFDQSPSKDSLAQFLKENGVQI